MIDTETDCAHLSVDMEAHPAGDGSICTHWVCRDCPAEFVPTEVMAEAEDHMGHMVEAMGILWAKYLRVRFALLMLSALSAGVFIGGIF